MREDTIRNKGHTWKLRTCLNSEDRCSGKQGHFGKLGQPAKWGHVCKVRRCLESEDIFGLWSVLRPPDTRFGNESCHSSQK